MRRYTARFATGPLHQRVKEIALEQQLLLQSSHALSIYGQDVVRAYEARAHALHQAADILRDLEGRYESRIQRLEQAVNELLEAKGRDPLPPMRNNSPRWWFGVAMLLAAIGIMSWVATL